MAHGTENPFGQFGSAVSAVSPPELLPTPAYLLREGRMRKRKSLDTA